MADVVFTSCASYDRPLEEALQRLLQPLGGWRRFVSSGQSVLIKPNLLSDRRPEDAVTTHPAVVRAIIRAVRSVGGVPSVADSPASAVKLEAVWEKTGFGSMCREESVPLLNLEKEGVVPCDVNGFRFHVARPFLETDVLISVPKVKTHTLTTLTAAVKNLYGTLPGYQKANLHKAYPHPDEFGQLLRAILERVPPALTVADGIVGMDGEGPSGGNPTPLGFLAVSEDAMALDRALCRRLNIRTDAVPYLRGSARREDAVLWTGSAPEAASPPFRAPSTLAARMIPSSLARWLARWFWIRPDPLPDACTRCGRCIEACPVQALSFGSEDQPPILEAAKCIGCCCCHEICPFKAIAMRQSPLMNLLRGGKPL